MLNHTKHAGVGAARERVCNFSAPERDTAKFPAQPPRWGGWDSGRRLRLVCSIGESLFLRYFMRVPMPFRKCYPHDLILSQKPHPTPPSWMRIFGRTQTWGPQQLLQSVHSQEEEVMVTFFPVIPAPAVESGGARCRDLVHSSYTVTSLPQLETRKPARL